MKYKFLILGILAVILLIVAFVGYSYLFSKPDPLKILNELYEKQYKVKEYYINYSFSAMGGMGGMSLTYGGNVSSIKINDTQKIVIKFGLQPFGSYEEYYYLPQGKFLCFNLSLMVPSKFVCERLKTEETIQKITPQGQLDLLNNWIKEGIVNITFNSTQKIIGRECYNFKFDVNVEKVANQLNFSNLSYSDLKNANLTFFECLDKDFGLPLFSKMLLAINNPTTAQISSMVVVLKATSLSFNAGINKIELPVAPENTSI